MGNQKVNEKLPDYVDKALDEARETIAKLEDSAEHIAKFDNPKEQFTTELEDLADTVHASILKQRDARVASGILEPPRPEAPRGIKGLIVRFVRKVRSLFSFFRRGKPKMNTGVTAYDVGAGIDNVYKSIVGDQEYASQKLPMLSKFLPEKLPRMASKITQDTLAFAAPELLHFFASMSANKDEWDDVIEGANKSPHEFRFVTRYKRYYNGYSLDGIQRAATSLLPAVRDVLPTSGAKVRQSFEEMQQLLKPKTESRAETPSAEDAKVGRFKKLKQKAKNITKKYRKKSN